MTYDQDWAKYRESGLQRAKELGNRGPVRFTADGLLAPDIVRSYQEHGFYVFEGMVSKQEVGEVLRELDEVLENAPTHEGGTTDKHGRPCRFPGYVKLTAPLSEQGARKGLLAGNARPNEEQVVLILSHPMMYMDSIVRLYAHPQILRMAEGLNGPDFVPFTDAIHYKAAGNGAATSWHQDGRTHWDAQGRTLETSDLASPSHGINLSVCCSEATPENCLWVVPGSEKSWLLHDGGAFPPISERLPGAVPMTLRPGDVGVVNRSSLHGSFPNQSEGRRVTILLGYHRRSSAIGTTTKNVHASKLYGEEKLVTYDEAYVNRRARIIPLAIDARHQSFPDEPPYAYRGITDGGDTRWNDETQAEMRQDGDEYWTRDITL